MAITGGDSTDGVRTGLAGRIANDIVAVFSSVTYPAGSNHQKGINALVQGIVDALNNDKIDAIAQLAGKASGQAHLTVATTLASGVATVINYDTVDEDTDSAITTGAAWKFTCKKAGQYHLAASGGMAGFAAAGGPIFITVLVNGAEARRGDRRNFVAFETCTLTVACDLQLAVNDYVQVAVQQNSGGAVNTETAAAVNHFSIHRLPGS